MSAKASGGAEKKRKSCHPEAHATYEVEEIRNHKHVGKSKDPTHYLVKWQGFSDTTWEKTTKLSNCQGCLVDYWRNAGELLDYDRARLKWQFEETKHEYKKQKKENDRLEKENDRLEKEIARLTAENLVLNRKLKKVSDAIMK
eukprot:SAG22_NODE_857_length_6837_cov_22.929059_6_plen_143_part_00